MNAIGQSTIDSPRFDDTREKKSKTTTTNVAVPHASRKVRAPAPSGNLRREPTSPPPPRFAQSTVGNFQWIPSAKSMALKMHHRSYRSTNQWGSRICCQEYYTIDSTARTLNGRSNNQHEVSPPRIAAQAFRYRSGSLNHPCIRSSSVAPSCESELRGRHILPTALQVIHPNRCQCRCYAGTCMLDVHPLA